MPVHSYCIIEDKLMAYGQSASMFSNRLSHGPSLHGFHVWSDDVMLCAKPKTLTMLGNQATLIVWLYRYLHIYDIFDLYFMQMSSHKQNKKCNTTGNSLIISSPFNLESLLLAQSIFGTDFVQFIFTLIQQSHQSDSG